MNTIENTNCVATNTTDCKTPPFTTPTTTPNFKAAHISFATPLKRCLPFAPSSRNTTIQSSRGAELAAAVQSAFEACENETAAQRGQRRQIALKLLSQLSRRALMRLVRALMRQWQTAQKDSLVAERQQALAVSERKVVACKAELAAKDSTIAVKDAQLEEKDLDITELEHELDACKAKLWDATHTEVEVAVTLAPYGDTSMTLPRDTTAKELKPLMQRQGQECGVLPKESVEGDLGVISFAGEEMPPDSTLRDMGIEDNARLSIKVDEEGINSRMKAHKVEKQQRREAEKQRRREAEERRRREAEEEARRRQREVKPGCFDCPRGTGDYNWGNKYGSGAKCNRCKRETGGFVGK